MSESPIDEIIVNLNEVDLNKSEVLVNFNQILQKICCDDLKRFECKTHFLVPDLMTAICDSLKSSNNAKIANAANLVAELGKHCTCRDFITNPVLVGLLLNNLKSSNLDVLIHSCRALANICFEKSEAQKLIIGQGGLKPVLTLLENCKVPNKIEHDPKFKTTLIGLLLNLVAENEDIHKQVFEENVLETLIQLIKQDLESSKASGISQNIFITFVALTETIPVDLIFTEEVCGLAVEMFRTSYNDDFCITALDFLEEAELPDTVKFNLAKSGLFQLFMNFLEHKPRAVTEKDLTKSDLTGRVLANLLTGDEAMGYLYELNGGEILTHLTKWLSSTDKDLKHAAILCIGNIARTDKHSTNIVDKNIHKSLMNILREETKDIKMQYAAISTLRNLTIPRVNKARLVKDGLITVLMPLMDLDVKTSSAVIYKLVGTLRQVIDGQESIARDLGCDEKMVGRLSTWASLTVHPWVSSECCRSLCWMVKISKDKNVILNVLRSGGYTHIMKLLGALHGLMQSEAVSALTVTSAVVLLELESQSDNKEKTEEKAEERVEERQNTKEEINNTIGFSDFERILVEGDIGEKLKHLILQHGVKMDEHILQNIFTFLEIVTKFEKIREHFREKGLKQVFNSTMQSREDFNRFRYRIEEIGKSL